MCNRACSDLTQMVMVIERHKVCIQKAFRATVSGQPRNLGSMVLYKTAIDKGTTLSRNVTSLSKNDEYRV